ncbi:MAG TPA: BlaI/MecI/CopY family transcriptional regulator [Gemmatimonadales bacterium]|nr:BlaI/MecI/CopY family transcriptional regulator [Gemmatimonadales bacterium]
MPRPNAADLSRRERQIMSIVYQQGRASAAEVLAELHDPPSYSAVRAHLRILEEKGHLRHETDGPRYVYLPTLPRDRARLGALRQVLQTFFDGSASQAVAALLDSADRPVTSHELDQLARVVDQARKEGR